MAQFTLIVLMERLDCLEVEQTATVKDIQSKPLTVEKKEKNDNIKTIHITPNNT